ncbi:hypothetical protein [Halorubrum tropicale]|uniref:Uncharacterized protein n=1 Tax=Halorubrum tropicale TaxID=1765655 RepID=A0A0M9AL67_9EURY|nr:hypothetical protein [Halorubrum tropicale]KOX94232.1 hypothetical protein AMR74_16120 [Halorubrum tropicale]
MNERNQRSIDANLESIELGEPERIGHLSELEVGDRVVWGDYTTPRTVVQLGVREKGREGDTDAHVETPLVKVAGPRGKVHILAHRIHRYEEQGDIVATEERTFSKAGRIAAVDIVRTHIGGSRCRVEGNQPAEVA